MPISLTRLSGGNTPADGSDPRTFPAIWNASATAIEDAIATIPEGGASVTVSETAPVSPTEGDLWLNSTEAKMYVYYNDGSSAQWVAAVGGTVPSQGKILQVVSVVKTDAFSASVASGGNTTITGLSITHSLSNASNKLLFIAYVGTAATNQQQGRVGIALADGGSLVGIADAVGSRARVAAGGKMVVSNSTDIHANLSINLLHSPGDTASHTYTLEAINMASSTHTLYINRNQTDADTINDGRSSSVLTLMEVAA